MSHTLVCWPLECLISTDSPARNTQQSIYNVKAPSTTYDPMLMTKEFNNEIIDQYTIQSMGKELLLHKWNKIEKLQPNP